MQGSRERVRAVLEGTTPDHIPLYDLLRNDAVIAHFAGEPATVENGADVVYRSYEPAIDATRPLIRTPNRECELTLADGRKQHVFRWTVWTSPKVYPSAEEYASCKKRILEAFDDTWTSQRQSDLDTRLQQYEDDNRRLGEVYRFLVGPSEWLESLYHEVGLDQFVCYMSDHPELIEDLIEKNARDTIAFAAHLPEGIGAVFLADDLAFRSGPLFNPRWLERVYMPRLARIVDAFHRRGMKVLFHSDGNLYRILEALVGTDIDALNPIEILAGMDVGTVHKRHPNLVMAGGIDVSELLPFGPLSAIRDTVRRTIDAAEGRIMIGSSTELHDAVPLANFLAMRDAVLKYRM